MTPVLSGRNRYNEMLAGAAILAAVALSVWLGALQSTIVDLIMPCAAVGGVTGFAVIGAAKSRVFVYQDHLLLRNYVREVRIERAAIAGLLLSSGIYVVLNDGRLVESSTWNPSLGKRLFTKNAAARQFGAQAAQILGVPTGVKPQRGRGMVGPEAYRARVRLDTLAGVLVAGLSAVGLAGMVRLTTG